MGLFFNVKACRASQQDRLKEILHSSLFTFQLYLVKSFMPGIMDSFLRYWPAALYANHGVND